MPLMRKSPSMQILNTAEVDPRTLSGLPRFAYYNGLDCMLTREIKEKLIPQLTPTTRSTYRFMFDLQAPALDMMLTGVPIDIAERERKILELTSNVERLRHILNLYGKALWGKPFNAGSFKQKEQLLYGVLKLPSQKQYDKASGSMRVTTSRAALERLAASHFRTLPIMKAILTYQDVNKALGILRSGIDRDGRIRASFGVAATETGRLNSKKNVFGRGAQLQNWRESWRTIFCAPHGPLPDRAKYAIPPEYRDLKPIRD